MIMLAAHSIYFYIFVFIFTPIGVVVSVNFIINKILGLNYYFFCEKKRKRQQENRIKPEIIRKDSEPKRFIGDFFIILAKGDYKRAEHRLKDIDKETFGHLYAMDREDVRELKSCYTDLKKIYERTKRIRDKKITLNKYFRNDDRTNNTKS